MTFRTDVESAGGFRPSNYDPDLTMDGTAKVIALASGCMQVDVTNRGVTTEAIRCAFGTSSANAAANLNISTGAATTGRWIGAAADGFDPHKQFTRPSNATHFAVANAVASDTQIVSVVQGS